MVENIEMGLADPDDLDAMLGRLRAAPIDTYLEDFEKSLRRKDNTKKHVMITMSRIKTVIEGCGFRKLVDLYKQRCRGGFRR